MTPHKNDNDKNITFFCLHWLLFKDLTRADAEGLDLRYDHQWWRNNKDRNGQIIHFCQKWHNFLEIIFKSLSSLSDDALYSSVALTQFYAAVLLLIYNPKSWSINRRNLLPHKVYCHISQNIRILWIKLIKNTKIFFIQDFFTMWIAIIFLPQLSMDINNLHRVFGFGWFWFIFDLGNELRTIII